jgi:cytochrome P450
VFPRQNSQATDLTQYPQFGQGSRTCIGKNISLLELNKCIPRLLRQFDFELATDAEMKCINHWFVKPLELRFNVKERPQ